MSRQDGFRPRCGTWHGDDQKLQQQILDRTSPVQNPQESYPDNSFLGSLSNSTGTGTGSRANAFLRQQPSEAEIKKQFEEAVISSIQGRDLKLDEVWNYVATKHRHLTEHPNWRTVIQNTLKDSEDIECDQQNRYFLKTDAIMTLSLTKSQLAQLNQGDSCLCLLPQETDFENNETIQKETFRENQQHRTQEIVKDEPVSSEIPSSDSPTSNIETPFTVSEPNTVGSEHSTESIPNDPVMSPLTDLTYLDTLTNSQQAEFSGAPRSSQNPSFIDRDVQQLLAFL